MSNDTVFNLSILWDNLTYEIEDRTGKVILLSNIYSYCKPGHSLGLLGPSGSAKTSLISLLSGRAQTGQAFGEFYVDGTNVLKSKQMKGKVGVVTQEDLIVPYLTVEESIKFHSFLRVSGSEEEKLATLQQILDDLSLNIVRNQIVGDAITNSHISGGERKRVNVGVELCGNMPILMLDEPTTNVDSTRAEQMIETFHKIAEERNISLIVSIHQPKYEIFQKFHRICVLCEGKVAYFGSADLLVEDLATLELQCPSETNLCDYLLDIVSNNSLIPISREQLQQLEKISRNRFIEEKQEILQTSSVIDSQNVSYGYNSSFAVQFHFLLQRAFRSVLRSKTTLVSRLLGSIFIALLIGFVYFGINSDQTGIQNRAGALFFIIMSITFTSISQPLQSYYWEKELVRRETYEHVYRTVPYFISRILPTLTTSLVWPFVTLIIVYPIVGFQSSIGNFLTFLLVLELVGLTAEQLGFLLALISPNQFFAQIVGPSILIIFALYSGFLVNSGSVPSWLKWIASISFLNYGYEILFVTEFQDLPLYCTTDQLVDGICPFTNGNEVIEWFGMANACVGCDIIYLVVIYLVILFLFFIYLKFFLSLKGTVTFAPSDDLAPASP
eukprot:TRINITY_DN302_c0_g1_i1.p1 TRINITY_DN302_c0_g1~~TRINITY_DN302_c0_g1_i1.p1  ORF type:complete len:613 (+),score=121.94 TRINITY_DN302_c0_g1_i1:43-1881(+)